MNISISAVKKTAIAALKNKYSTGVMTAAILVFSFIVCFSCTEMAYFTTGAAGGTLLLILLIVFLLFPLASGYVYCGTHLILTGESDPLLIFKYFTSKQAYARVLKLSVLITGNAAFAGALLFLPCFAVDMLASGKLFMLLGAQIPLWASSLWTVSAVLKAAAAFALLILMIKYYLAPFLIAADEDMDPFEAVHMSKVISTRSKKDFLLFLLSFIGYIIAGFLVIPIIFILPYFSTSYSVFCRFAVAAYNTDADRVNRADIPSFDASISF